jgi:hypothetical protein
VLDVIVDDYDGELHSWGVNISAASRR